MREILFRGKRTDNGEWVWGFLAFDGVNEDYYIYDREVDKSTVGQYTGLQDENGKRIFEGDVVKITERGKTASGGKVIFENGYPGGWLVSDKDETSKCSLAMRTDIEVIGNIHDNPELMDGGVENA